MRKTKAFTLLELIMVIVIMGIIASIGSDIISTMYQNYLRSRAVNRLEAQTEIVLEQIAKRLSYRVKRSTGIVRGGNILPLSQANQNDTTMVWIGISEESRMGGWNGATFVPGWSGLIDLNSTNTSSALQTISTPGSRLDFAGVTISALTDGDVTMNNNRVAIMMKTPYINDADISRYWLNADPTNNYTTTVRRGANSVFTIDAADRVADYTEDGNRDIYEHYYLSHTAYALVPEGADANDFTLTLRYNFQPWNNESATNAIATPVVGASRAVLAEHVSTFRFLQVGSSIRLKLCISDAGRSADFDFSACKETVVF